MSIPLQHVDAFRLTVDVLSEMASRPAVDFALRDVGVGKDALNATGLFLPYALQAAVVEGVARRIGERSLGAIAAERFPYDGLGPYARYVLGAPTLEGAIRRGKRALPYLQPGSAVTLRPEGDRLLLGFCTGIERVVGVRHIEEAMPLLLRQLVRAFLGPQWQPLGIEVPRSPETREAELADLHPGTEIRIGAPAPAIAIPLADLSAPNPCPPPVRQVAVLPDVRAMLRSHPPRSDAELVGHMLDLQIRCGDPSEDGVARRLGIGRRTLQRRLQAEGTNFRALQQRALEARARALLAERDHSVAGVADALGFREVNSFRRAFRSWTGLTPTTYASLPRSDGALPPFVTEDPDQSQGTT